VKTRQELADELLALGFDQASLAALLDALRGAKVTGYGTVSVTLFANQIAKCEFSGTVKAIREKEKF